MEADAAQMPRATVVSFPGLSHFGPLEQPGAVAAAVVATFGAPGDTPRS
jgi:pimeloyl-ACP methyl ester carboxylesterase